MPGFASLLSPHLSAPEVNLPRSTFDSADLLQSEAMMMSLAAKPFRRHREISLHVKASAPQRSDVSPRSYNKNKSVGSYGENWVRYGTPRSGSIIDTKRVGAWQSHAEKGRIRFPSWRTTDRCCARRRIASFQVVPAAPNFLRRTSRRTSSLFSRVLHFNRYVDTFIIAFGKRRASKQNSLTAPSQGSSWKTSPLIVGTWLMPRSFSWIISNASIARDASRWQSFTISSKCTPAMQIRWVETVRAQARTHSMSWRVPSKVKLKRAL
jgi:hypothetical protein